VKKISRVFLLFALYALPFFPFAFSAQAQTPKLVYSKSLAAPGESGNGFKITYGGSMGTGTLANNLLTIRITSPHGSTVSSIVDNKGTTYTLGVSVDSGSGGWITSLFYAAGIQAGVTLITVNYSSSVADWHGAVMEYSGVATTSPADGTCSNSNTNITCSSAITTTGSNDLVIASMIGLGSTIEWNRLSTITPGGSFFLDAADTQCSDADEEYVQPSAGAVTPSFTVTGSSQSFNIVGMAFKAQPNAGTNPTNMYILHQQHVQVSGSGPATFNSYFVSSGNLLVVSFELGTTFTTYSIDSCTPSNTWTKESEGSYWPQFFYLPSSATFSTNLHCTVHGGGSGNNGMFVIYDVVGAAAIPFDVLASGQSQGNGGFVSGTVTPTIAPGIFFGAANDGIGPVTRVGASGTAGAIFDNTTYTGETDAGQLNNGDAWQHLFFNSTSTITYTWTMANGSSYMQASGIAFASAGGGLLPPAPPTGLKATVQ
jgi:hypothetical protein